MILEPGALPWLQMLTSGSRWGSPANPRFRAPSPTNHYQQPHTSPTTTLLAGLVALTCVRRIETRQGEQQKSRSNLRRNREPDARSAILPCSARRRKETAQMHWLGSRERKSSLQQRVHWARQKHATITIIQPEKTTHTGRQGVYSSVSEQRCISCTHIMSRDKPRHSGMHMWNRPAFDKRLQGLICLALMVVLVVERYSAW
jgi:hypothetical protein